MLSLFLQIAKTKNRTDFERKDIMLTQLREFA